MSRLYLYVYLDPLKKGDYDYSNFKFKYEPFYGRICDNLNIGYNLKNESFEYYG